MQSLLEQSIGQGSYRPKHRTVTKKNVDELEWQLASKQAAHNGRTLPRMGAVCRRLACVALSWRLCRQLTLVVYAPSVALSISRESPKSAILHTKAELTRTFRAAKSCTQLDGNTMSERSNKIG